MPFLAHPNVRDAMSERAPGNAPIPTLDRIFELPYADTSERAAMSATGRLMSLRSSARMARDVTGSDSTGELSW
jgi:hypothetical protein